MTPEDMRRMAAWLERETRTDDASIVADFINSLKRDPMFRDGPKEGR